MPIPRVAKSCCNHLIGKHRRHGPDLWGDAMRRRDFITLLAAVTCAAALAVMPRMAAAQSYPVRPITLIVPYPAGGGADTVARVTAERMRAFLGQSVIIENVGGASG